MERGWRHGGHRDLVVTVRRLAEESGDAMLENDFEVARRFHANFYQNFMEDAVVENFRPNVHEFVPRVLAFLDSNTER